MHHIPRSLAMLKSALPDSSLHYAPAHLDDVARLRYEVCGVIAQLNWLFSGCPEVVGVTVIPRLGDGDEEDAEIAAVDLAVHLVSRSGDSSPIVLRYSTEWETQERVEAAERICAAIGRKFDISAFLRLVGSENRLFVQQGSLALTREANKESISWGALDFDGFYSRRDGAADQTAERQSQLSQAPAYWNRATVVGIPDRLEAGMSVDACDSNGVSALVAATVFANDWSMTSLCRAGADPNMVDGTGHSAVSAAIAAKNWPGFRSLVDAGGNPDGPKFMPTLLVAFETGSADVGVAQVLEHGGDVARIMPDGVPFNAALDRFKGRFVREEREWEWGKVSEMVLSKSAELSVADSIGYVGDPDDIKVSKTELAL
jgi:hypothetical protein